jgi:tetratricopeptide (TPR) repeat protein
MTKSHVPVGDPFDEPFMKPQRRTNSISPHRENGPTSIVERRAGRVAARLHLSRSAFFFAMAVLFGSGCGTKEDETAKELLKRRSVKQANANQDEMTREQRIATAERFIQDGFPRDALREIKPLLVLTPEDVRLIAIVAKCEASIGNRKAAIETISTVTKSDPEAYSRACLLWAHWLSEEGQTDAAIAKLMEIIDESGYQNRVRHKLATLFHSQGQRLQAAEHLRELAKNGDISEKELFSLVSLSDAFIDETLPKPDLSQELTPASLVMAMQYRLDNKPNEALALLKRIQQALPELSEANLEEGRLLAETQQLDALHSWLENASPDLENHPNYWFALGTWLQSEGKFAEAVRCFGETVSRDETDRQAYLWLARALTSLERHREAAVARERHERLDETNVIAGKLGNREGSSIELARMAEILDQLHRPWEAVAWREVAARTHRASAQELASLRSRRQELSSKSSEHADNLFQTCGVDLKDWPLSDDTMKRAKPRRVVELQRTATQNKSVFRLVNVAPEIGLDFQYDNGDDRTDVVQFLHQITGGGIGVIDFDLDGWHDVYLGQGGGDAFDSDGSLPNQLFRNLSGKRFVNATSPSATGDLGYAQGVTVADLNQDGFPDIVVANIGDNVIYINHGDGTFARQSLPFNAEPGMWTTSIACGDLSGDHLPEIVEINYVDDARAMKIPCTAKSDLCNPSTFKPAVDRVWQMQADGSLKLWQGCSELESKPNYGFAGIIANFDRKAGNDLFIANDTLFNHFWLSSASTQGGPYSLIESAVLRGCAAGLLGQRQGCMGVAQGDFDNNGWLDLHITNFWNQPSDLYLNHASGNFTNGTVLYGLHSVTQQTVGWGTQAVDFDHDGWLDLVIVNGHTADHRDRGEPYEMLPQLFRGTEFGFEPVKASTIGDDYWSQPAMGRTVATFDWNRDGKTDLLINHLDKPLVLLENRTQGGTAIQIELVGVASERDAVGACVTLRSGSWSRTAWATGGDGFLCNNESTVELTNSSAGEEASIEVAWPSGATQVFPAVREGVRYQLIEGEDLKAGVD